MASPAPDAHWQHDRAALQHLVDRGRLVEMCIDAACRSKESIGIWRRQKRTIQRLPIHLAEPLLHRLLHDRLLTAPLLELFQSSVQEVNVSGEPVVDAQWMAYFGSFCHLRVLRAADCRSVSNASVRSLAGLNCLEELDLSRCTKVTDDGLKHLCCLKNLRKLDLSETGVGGRGLNYLSLFTSLTSLDLGGLPMTDEILSSLLDLNQLEHLNIWGSTISNKGALLLPAFPHLRSLNLAWTGVTVVPPLSFLRCLNMSQCRIVSIFYGWDSSKAPLEELHLSGSDILAPGGTLVGHGTRNVAVLDLSGVTMANWNFLAGLKSLDHLDLSGTNIQNCTMLRLTEVGKNLRQLDLSGTKVESQGVGILAGYVPKLERISLSGTMVDDSVLSFLGLMPALREIDLSHTAIKGYLAHSSSFTALEHLQQLRTLNLKNTLMSNKSCRRMACLGHLSYLYLRGDFLSDASLQYLSSNTDLILLSVQGAVLTDFGLLGFKTPPFLQELDVTDCWLLTEKGILEFCKANPGVFVRHELLPNELEIQAGLLGGSKNEVVKNKKGYISDVIRSRKSTIISRMPMFQNCRKTEQSYAKERWGKKQSSPFFDDQWRGVSKKIDERIKYNLSSLLDLRQSLLSNQYLEALQSNRTFLLLHHNET